MRISNPLNGFDETDAIVSSNTDLILSIVGKSDVPLGYEIACFPTIHGPIYGFQATVQLLSQLAGLYPANASVKSADSKDVVSSIDFWIQTAANFNYSTSTKELEAVLSKTGPFLLGDSVSLADVVVWAAVFYALKSCSPRLPKNVAHWYELCSGLALFQK